MTAAEQLLLLVGSGEKRKLTPAEATALRDGIRGLASQAAATHPHHVPCTHCGAPAGQPCTSTSSPRPPATPHTARLYAAAVQTGHTVTYLKGQARTDHAHELRARYEAGDTIRNLATAYGRSYGCIHALLLAAGTTMRPHGFQARIRQEVTT